MDEAPACSQGLAGNPEGHWPWQPRKAYPVSNRADNSETDTLSMEQTTTIVRLLPPEGKKRRPAWLLAALLGLPLLPFHQSAARQLTSQIERPGPTNSVVAALNRAILAPAQAQAHSIAPTVSEGLLAPIEASQPAALGRILKTDGKPLFLGPAGDRERAIDCLALAAWYEAGNDVESQRSVIQVVLNRVAHPSFPKSVCGVVFQGSQRSTGCQFTFTCDGSMLLRLPPKTSMARARALAAIALQGAIFPAVMQATHYHADYVLPWWASKLVQRGRVGRHIFYSWPGQRGILPGRPSSVGEVDLARFVRPSAIRTASVPEPIEPTMADTAATAPQLAAARPLVTTTVPTAPAPKPGNAILLAVDRTSPSGRWAVSALGRCTGKDGCRVLGYETQDQIARNSSVTGTEREKPVFLFVRDAASGIELALWDCEKIPRPTPSQCLPAPGRELTRLLRDNQS